MDLQSIEPHAVRSLRGRRSQTRMSQLLGLQFNQVSKWENGQKRLRWREFIAICQAVDAPLSQALADFFKYRGDPLNLTRFVTGIAATSRHSQIATLSGCSRFQVRRWLSGTAEANFSDVLNLMHCHRGGLAHIIAFLDALIDLRRLPALAAMHECRTRRIIMEYAQPWVSVICHCLSLFEYQALEEHVDGFVATNLGISLAEEKRALKDLVDTGVVVFAHGKYAAVSAGLLRLQENVLYSAADIAGNIHIRDYWVERALNFLRADPDWRSMRFSYMTFAVSRPTFRAMLDRSIEYFRALNELVDNDSGPKEVLQGMNLHIFPLSAPAAKQ